MSEETETNQGGNLEGGQEKGQELTSGPVVIPSSELQVIVRGLQEMPNAVNKMANAVEMLTKTVRTSPTKIFTIVCLTLMFVANAAFFMWSTSENRDVQQALARDQATFLRNQEEAAERGVAIRDAVSRISDCIDFIAEEEQDNECAQRLVAMAQVQNEQNKLVVNCAVQLGIREFFLQNPDLEVYAPKVSPSCLPVN